MLLIIINNNNYIKFKICFITVNFARELFYVIHLYGHVV